GDARAGVGQHAEKGTWFELLLTWFGAYPTLLREGRVRWYDTWYQRLVQHSSFNTSDSTDWHSLDFGPQAAPGFWGTSSGLHTLSQRAVTGRRRFTVQRLTTLPSSCMNSRS
ncbi:unnamed protein product, partial [Ectocarpus sp. 13 AM-2016]